MRFQVRVVDGQQQVQTIFLEALDETDARSQVQERQLTPLTVKSAAGLYQRRELAFALILFAHDLHALLAAGLSVIEALDTLVEKDVHVSRRQVIARLARDLREGHRLSSALRRQPEIFTPLFIGIVQAAEGTSDVPRALSRYIDYETRLQVVRHKVVSAAIYPAILLTVGSAVSIFLLGYVVPRFASVYQGNGRPLPWASQMLMGWGQFAGDHAAWLSGALALTVLSAFLWARLQMTSGGWWRLLGLLPGARARLEILQLSRFYLTLGMLLEGGIAVQQALGLCSAVMDPSRQPALLAVRQQVEAGQTFSDALERQGLSTPVALRLLRVGEKSGQLGLMLSRTAAFYESETTRWIERFTKAFEPVLMAAIGLIIGLIVILLYMPVFDLAGSLQ